MTTRERLPDAGGPGDPPAGGDGGALDRLRGQAEDFLAAGDEAIRRGLSTNSESFVRSSRQRGGQ
jgi:hypothetical protein